MLGVKKRRQGGERTTRITKTEQCPGCKGTESFQEEVSAGFPLSFTDSLYVCPAPHSAVGEIKEETTRLGRLKIIADIDGSLTH